MTKRKPRDVTADDTRQLRHPPVIDFGAVMAAESATEHAAHVQRIAAKRAQAERMEMPVGEYFEYQLGHPLSFPTSHHREGQQPYPDSSPYHKGFTITGGCGNSCANAIDAAALLLSHVHSAFGENESNEEHFVIDAVESVVLCYVYG